MLNKFAILLGKDKQIALNFFLLLIVFFVFNYLNSESYKERKIFTQLKSRQKIISQIPALENQLKSPFRGMILNGIIFNQELPMAIVNNNLLKEGDFVTGNIKVAVIKQDSVILNNGSQDFELKLRE